MKNILFVCVGNSGRSLMAETFTRILSGGKVSAQSAGTKPAKQADPMVRRVMNEKDFKLRDDPPALVTQEMVDKADLIFSMGCSVKGSCLSPSLITEDWGLDDPFGKDIEAVRRIRDQVETKVLRLLSDLGR
jgi:arsenate reductase